MEEYEIRKVLYYSKEHGWAKKEATGLVRIGITDYAQKRLHEVIFVELPTVNTTVVQGKPYGTVESVKAVVELCAPVSGIIKEINEMLREKPSLVNDDPYGSGWIATLDPTDFEGELKNLLPAPLYKTFIEEESKK